MPFGYPGNRQMKLWELCSVFHAEEGLLESVFGSPKWRTQYLDWYTRYNELVANQECDKLYELVPLELSRDVASASEAKFVLNLADRHLRAIGSPQPKEGESRVMTALEVHEEFGGPCMEEVYEKGSAIIPEDMMP